MARRRTFKQVAEEAAHEARYHAIAECCRWIEYDAPVYPHPPRVIAEMLWRAKSGSARMADFTPQPPPDRWLDEPPLMGWPALAGRPVVYKRYSGFDELNVEDGS